MLTYKTDRPNNNFLYRNILRTIIILSLPVLVGRMLPTLIIKDSYFWIAGALLAMRIIDELNRKRVLEIRIDKENNQLSFQYKSILSALSYKIIPLNETQIEIAQSKSDWKWLIEPFTIYFLNNKKELFTINRSKDGFSVDKLIEIYKTIESSS
jgi:hypothetical protein